MSIDKIAFNLIRSTDAGQLVGMLEVEFLLFIEILIDMMFVLN